MRNRSLRRTEIASPDRVRGEQVERAFLTNAEDASDPLAQPVAPSLRTTGNRPFLARPTANQLRQTYENGMAARAHGQSANPFEDPFAADWPGRGDYAAAWSRGCDDWDAMEQLRASGVPAQPPGLSILETRLAAFREKPDHRRRVLEHQAKIAAEQRAAAGQPSDRQLNIPLIGEVRRPEPSPPRPKRRRAIKPDQPELGKP